MILSLDRKPSRKILIVMIVLGGILFVPSFAAGNLLLRAVHADPAGFAAAWQSLNPERIAAWYRNTGNTLPQEVVNYAAIAGYTLFSFGASLFLARKVAAGRAFRRLCFAAAFIGPAAALCDLFAMTAILIALGLDFRVPDALLRLVLVCLNLKGIVWIGFLWLLFVSVFIAIDQWRRRRPGRPEKSNHT
jgi:hypothetical protein